MSPYSGFPRSCNNQSSTADRERGLRMRNVISRGTDAALRTLVTARQLKSRWKEVVVVYFLLLCGCTLLSYPHKQSYEHACRMRATLDGTVLQDLGNRCT